MSRLSDFLGWISGVFLVLAALKFLPFLDLPFKGAYPALWLFLSMARSKRWVLSAAFLLCALGDVMGIMGRFPLQVVFFGMAQLLFILLFFRNRAGRPTKTARIVLVGLLWMVMLVAVWMIVRQMDALPLVCLVLIYALLLLSMASSALFFAGVSGVAGALLFVLSDTMIGVRNFLTPFTFSGEAIMITYYAALLLLFMGFFAKSRLRDAVC